MVTVELGVPNYGLRPDHGLHDPQTGSPDRRPGSIRRTTSIDTTGMGRGRSDVTLDGAARDLVTMPDGTARELGTSALHAQVDMAAGARLREFSTVPRDDRWDDLVGRSAMGGFRRAADELAPEHRNGRSTLYSLVDDVPVTTLVSGHAMTATLRPGDTVRAGTMPVPDQCAGFITGGTMMAPLAQGRLTIVTGPVAPSLEHPDDHLAWHPTGDLPLHGMRRVRRIDVWHEGDEVRVDAMFRDSYVRGDGVLTVIHEYDLDATVDSRTRRLTHCEARPRVLPWLECPAAVASAGRLVAMTLDELHDGVRRELRGTSSCTHLNDLLRSLGDVVGLVRSLDDALAADA